MKVQGSWKVARGGMMAIIFRKRALAWAFGLAIAGQLGFAQSGLQAPQPGWMLDANGNLRSVYGVAGATTLSDPVLSGVLAFGCSGQFCLAKIDTSIVPLLNGVPGAPVDAPAGLALFSMTERPALVYFAGSQQLMQWDQGALASTSYIPDGEVLAVQALATGAELAVRRNDRVWIEQVSFTDGSVSETAALSDDVGAVLLLKSAMVYTTRRYVVLERSDGSDIRFDCPGVEAIYAMGTQYVQVRAKGAIWALSLVPGKERLFLLPGVAP